MGKSEFNKDGNLIHTLSTLPLQIAVLFFYAVPENSLFSRSVFSVIPTFNFCSFLLILLHSFIHSSTDIYQLSVDRVPGTVLGTREILVSKKHEVFALA